MNTIKLKSAIRYLLVIGIGLVVCWNISFFHPFKANYPPGVSYKTLTSNNGLPDTVLAAPGPQYGRNRVGEFFLGKHYRSLWTTPIKVKVLHIAAEGLVITKRGGGMQTTSLTLENRAGEQFSLRSVDKDPISVIPPFLWTTAIGNFVRDQVSATNPYALMPVLNLTEKAGIAKAEARLVFVLKGDPAFLKFNINKSGFFYLAPKYLKPIGSQPEQKLQVLTSVGMLQALKMPGNAVDTAFYLKCRLFDLLIGDWDRHAGQWDWVGFKANGKTIFKPIPKDRDQAFGYYQDGLLPYIFSRNFLVRKITSFSPDYQDIPGFSQNGSDLDSKILKDYPPEKVKQLVAELQTNLNDAALREALRYYPKSVYSLIGEEHFKTLKARRQHLPEAAADYLEIIRERP